MLDAQVLRPSKDGTSRDVLAISVPKAQKPSAMATRNMTWPSNWEVEIARGAASSR